MDDILHDWEYFQDMDPSPSQSCWGLGYNMAIKLLTQLSSSVLNVCKDLVRENFHARLVLFISWVNELFSNMIDRVPSNVSLDTKMKVRYVQYH